jgi:hypothetical protein
MDAQILQRGCITGISCSNSQQLGHWNERQKSQWPEQNQRGFHSGGASGNCTPLPLVSPSGPPLAGLLFAKPKTAQIPPARHALEDLFAPDSGVGSGGFGSVSDEIDC